MRTKLLLNVNICMNLCSPVPIKNKSVDTFCKRGRFMFISLASGTRDVFKEIFTTVGCWTFYSLQQKGAELLKNL